MHHKNERKEKNSASNDWRASNNYVIGYDVHVYWPLWLAVCCGCLQPLRKKYKRVVFPCGTLVASLQCGALLTFLHKAFCGLVLRYSTLSIGRNQQWLWCHDVLVWQWADETRAAVMAQYDCSRLHWHTSVMATVSTQCHWQWWQPLHCCLVS